MNWHWPQYVMAVTLAIRVGAGIQSDINWHWDAKDRSGLLTAIFATIGARCIDSVVLYFGGFWTP